MSLYNMIHGQNYFTPILKFILNLDQPDDQYPTGRFRDVFVNEDGSRIVVVTRNGGGNRPDYRDVFKKLATHPHYLRDWDDSFDSTYAYIEFRTPMQFADIVKELSTGKPVPTIKALFEEAQLDMTKMSKEELLNDPRFKRMTEMMTQLVARIKQHHEH